MLFARFLAENGLLMHPDGVSVTLADCAELAPDVGEPDAWSLAARYASAMLPGIFRLGDPAVQVRLAPEGRRALERILADLPSAVFTADDALGWVYQFWQTKRKREASRSRPKIGGADLAAYSQLFTEDYMVRFLLENSLGAWWAARHPQSPLVKRFEYLRWRDDGTPAAGSFPGWPERAAEVTVMDPCCGSGHFLVAAFDILRRMRIEEEGLTEAEAADRVLRDNLFGLELDQRCTQIATFALLLAAWKAGGYRPLPLPNIACSGIAVEGQLEDWTRLARTDTNLRYAVERLHALFRQAPELGSLINPADLTPEERMFVGDYARLAPLLDRALARETAEDPTAAVLGEAARAVARAASLLTRQYTLVATNVPYLGIRKQNAALMEFCQARFPDSRFDLATAFVERCRRFTAHGGAYALVTPQNWLFLGSYKRLRERMLREQTWEHVSRLGPGAFDTISGEVVNVALSILSIMLPVPQQVMTGIDASAPRGAAAKASLLLGSPLQGVEQAAQLRNPGARISVESASGRVLLRDYADSYAGIMTGDSPRFQRMFWELPYKNELWAYQQGTVQKTQYSGGKELLVYYDEINGHLREDAKIRRERLHDSDRRGNQIWGKRGIVVSQMRQLPVTLYLGGKYDNNVVVIVPKNQTQLATLWSFCSSDEYRKAVRALNQKLSVDPSYLIDIPFDLDYWRQIAEEKYPNGLPAPHSDDPTQWLFKGHPKGSTEPLQVAIARLLGYHWPQQEADSLDSLVVEEGIACVPPVAGQPPAAERLRALLAAAYGTEWSSALQEQLLAAAGSAGKGLDAWLRDDFFGEHCRLFHNRPFVWHVWDGHRDGFSALINYHSLDRARLDKLIYSYLGDWIAARRADRDAGLAGAEGRLLAAQDLQKKLVLIREGEPPYDIYVRWKPLHEQPIGWEPDLNDGVRLNIRPFVKAGVLRTPFTIGWSKDRGHNPDGGERLNDLNLTTAEKRAARAAAGQG
ncbi:MAG: DNA methyltransferase [Dehalococcoidia bacterium]